MKIRHQAGMKKPIKAPRVIFGISLFYLVIMFFAGVSFAKGEDMTLKQVPAEGSILNYRLVGFAWESTNGAVEYIIEIANGKHDAEDGFERNIVRTATSVDNKIITEVPSFGANYTWRIISKKGTEAVTKSRFYHFSTGKVPNADTTQVRMRIMKEAAVYKDALVFSDGNKALYDMAGKPVWYLPDIEGNIKESTWVRDMQLTPQGTITFVLNEQSAYEINYNGEVLWKGPENDKHTDGAAYHHQLTRLDNGHYMTLSSENIYWKKKTPTAKDPALYVISHKVEDENEYQTFPFETLLEYDEHGKLVWQWDLWKYIKAADLMNYSPAKMKTGFDVRVNAFYFDKSAKVVYLSFKHVSRIIKIRYPDGAVLNTYGEVFKPGLPERGNDLFCHQHNCRISQKGYLYLFNNGCDQAHPPKITMMEEPKVKGGRLKKIWEYECDLDGIIQNTVSAAGSVFELPDNSLFVSAGTPYTKLFIVNMNKQILWSALPEKWNATDKKWQVNPSYKSSIITSREEIAKMIWRR